MNDLIVLLMSENALEYRQKMNTPTCIYVESHTNVIKLTTSQIVRTQRASRKKKSSIEMFCDNTNVSLHNTKK